MRVTAGAPGTIHSGRLSEEFSFSSRLTCRTSQHKRSSRCTARHLVFSLFSVMFCGLRAKWNRQLHTECSPFFHLEDPGHSLSSFLLSTLQCVFIYYTLCCCHNGSSVWFDTLFFFFSWHGYFLCFLSVWTGQMAFFDLTSLICSWCEWNNTAQVGYKWVNTGLN